MAADHDDFVGQGRASQLGDDVCGWDLPLCSGLHLECDDDAVKKLLAWVDDQGLSEITWADIEAQLKELLPDLFQQEK